MSLDSDVSEFERPSCSFKLVGVIEFENSNAILRNFGRLSRIDGLAGKTPLSSGPRNVKPAREMQRGFHAVKITTTHSSSVVDSVENSLQNSLQNSNVATSLWNCVNQFREMVQRCNQLSSQPE